MSNKLLDMKFPCLVPGTPLTFQYTNWRDVTEQRTVTPLKLQFGTTPEHHEPTWLLFSFCHDRKAHRSFMLSKMLDVKEVVQ